ncbi:MAG: hypothetical protein ACYTG4_09140 [Planctomycetota bacterium]|jgi:hypothetical protein
MTHPSFYRTGFFVALTACAFLAGLQLGGGSAARAQDVSVPAPGGGGGGATSDSNGDMIAVTGTSSSGAAVLYLVDTRKQKLLVYQGTGKNIEFIAARNIEFDLKIDAYRDISDDEVQVPVLRAQWIKAQKK